MHVNRTCLEFALENVSHLSRKLRQAVYSEETVQWAQSEVRRDR